MSTRRRFLRNLGNAGLLLPLASLANIPDHEIEQRIIPYERRYSANDVIRIGVVGFGIMGLNNTRTALKVPGVELAAVCDLYKGRLERAKELYGANLFTTQNFSELLDRKDIDAVIVATSDNWHDVIAIEAMRKGKAVYCEKPLMQNIDQGVAMVKAQKETGKPMQVGSQRISSIVYAKAKELYQQGEIGTLNCIEASFDRHDALGAWQYTMPLDISPDTVDWKRFNRHNPKAAFDPKQFFWWRNYREHGTGVAGDLFVHLLTGIHFITGSHGPSRIFASGDTSYWKDGRNVPDVMTGVMEYKATPQHPAFQVLLKVNFASGGERPDDSRIRFYGSDGSIDFGGGGIQVYRNKLAKAPGYGGWDAMDTYPKAMQEQIIAAYNKRWSDADKKNDCKEVIKFQAPQGYNEHLDHHMNFFEAVRTGKPVIEDALFGFRAAAPCLLANESYFQGKVMHWDGMDRKLL
ncbi:Predicted dehydrogenase [Cnuella takakiae]|uniref:Predicted dehydrogenase n=1 Tax=Cnuella takakiae TaxID=1302690 RepID=A0A1M5I7G3_9BACT|nr:Gfo/Idh/MocA family oxidoreductase [Cnuella takakiae]OLY93206.1 oxidoreductase [Cnuella takakiae]SHG24245.1 Predicted dehydrogenase [Cnuella takakiae]